MFDRDSVSVHFLFVEPEVRNPLRLEEIKISKHFLTLWVSSDVATAQVRITNLKIIGEKNHEQYPQDFVS
jgi:hypothetical protein